MITIAWGAGFLAFIIGGLCLIALIMGHREQQWGETPDDSAPLLAADENEAVAAPAEVHHADTFLRFVPDHDPADELQPARQPWVVTHVWGMTARELADQLYIATTKPRTRKDVYIPAGV
jgi:hypothetical protein